MPPTPPTPPTPEIPDIPRGYIQGYHDDGTPFIVPQFLLPDLDFGFAAHREKSIAGVINYPPNLSQPAEIEQDKIAGGLLDISKPGVVLWALCSTMQRSKQGLLMDLPPNPVPSPQERLAAHAEIIALQNQFGISYKDASHRLYMVEVEKLKVLDVQCKTWANLAASLKTSLGSTSTGDLQEENQENQEKK